MLRPQRSAGGLTLVEVLISIVLLAVFLIGLTPALTATAILQRQNDQVAAATNLAQQQIEAVREAWQTGNYHLTNTNYLNNNLNNLAAGLSTVGSAYTFGNFAIAGVNTQAVVSQSIDRPFSWYPKDDVLPNGQVSIGQFADVVPALPGNRAVAGSEFVVRTTVEPIGPQSYCSGSGSKTPCTDTDSGVNTNLRFNRVSNATSAPFTPPAVIVCANPADCRAPIDPNNDVRLFKRVRVAVYKAAADGTPLNVGGVEVQSLRTANADTATTRIQSGPLAVMTTDF